MSSIALARADARRWCRPRQEAGLIMRIAAGAASRPPGVGPGPRRPEPPRPPRAPSTTRPAIPSGNPAERAHNCIRRQMPAAVMACYLPRHRPFAGGTFKCAVAAINMPGRRPLPVIAAPRPPPRAATTGSSPRSVSYLDLRKGRSHSPFAGPLRAAAQARDLPGQAPGPPTRNATEISAVH